MGSVEDAFQTLDKMQPDLVARLVLGMTAGSADEKERADALLNAMSPDQQRQIAILWSTAAGKAGAEAESPAEPRGAPASKAAPKKKQPSPLSEAEQTAADAAAEGAKLRREVSCVVALNPTAGLARGSAKAVRTAAPSPPPAPRRRPSSSRWPSRSSVFWGRSTRRP